MKKVLFLLLLTTVMVTAEKKVAIFTADGLQWIRMSDVDSITFFDEVRPGIDLLKKSKNTFFQADSSFSQYLEYPVETVPNSINPPYKEWMRLLSFTSELIEDTLGTFDSLVIEYSSSFDLTVDIWDRYYTKCWTDPIIPASNSKTSVAFREDDFTISSWPHPIAEGSVLNISNYAEKSATFTIYSITLYPTEKREQESKK